MANGSHEKNLAQSETLCTWRSSLRGTWEVSSIPGLVCRVGSGTRSELQGRKVIALGDIAAAECARHQIEHIAVCHPSRRENTNEKNATETADAIGALGFGRAVKENPSIG
jgi:hypothetical protein